jgi:hypothetical protein
MSSAAVKGGSDGASPSLLLIRVPSRSFAVRTLFFVCVIRGNSSSIESEFGGETCEAASGRRSGGAPVLRVRDFGWDWPVGEVFIGVGDVDPPVVVAVLGVAGGFGEVGEPALLVAELGVVPFFAADEARGAGEVGVAEPVVGVGEDGAFVVVVVAGLAVGGDVAVAYVGGLAGVVQLGAGEGVPGVVAAAVFVPDAVGELEGEMIAPVAECLRGRWLTPLQTS